MRLVCKSRIEKAWLAASLLIFVAHRMMYGSPGLFLPDSVRVWLEVSMILLSFPLGVGVLFVINDAVYWCVGCGELKWMVDWPTLLVAGYIQWFWLLPEFLRGRKLTLLDLKLTAANASPNQSADDPELSPAPSHAVTFAPPLAEFDEAGLSALERVLRQ